MDDAVPARFDKRCGIGTSQDCGPADVRTRGYLPQRPHFGANAPAVAEHDWTGTPDGFRPSRSALARNPRGLFSHDAEIHQLDWLLRIRVTMPRPMRRMERRRDCGRIVARRRDRHLIALAGKSAIHKARQ
jgi:hypothetical protein